MIALLLLMLAAPAAAQVKPMPPQSVWETPAMKEARSLAESTKAAPAGWLTKAERTEFRETGNYPEAVAFYRKLERSSKYARLLRIGATAEGRDLYCLVASKDAAFTPAAARRAGKPVVLLQNGIHPGENGGKDAAMMLLRDILVTRRLARVLDHAIVLSIPVFNADGHERISPYNRINENGPTEMGFRVTARRLNLNRDYMKADTEEMRAWLSLYTAWLPDFLIDNHVTDGGDVQYDFTFASHTEQDIDPEVGAWVRDRYVPAMLKDVESAGHIAGWYVEGRSGDALTAMTASPRYSTGYAAAQNRASLLIETHSLKSFRTRVWSHYDVMRATLDIMSAEGAALRRASIDADTRMEALRTGGKVFLEGTPAGEGEPYVARRLKSTTYQGTAAGGPVTRYLADPLDQPVRLLRTLKERLAITAPAGYIVPAEWGDVIETLRRHGVRMERAPKEVRGQFESIRFEGAQFATSPFEGRFLVRGFKTRTSREAHVLAASSVFIPVAQRAGKVAMHFLEPEAVDSAVRWGFFQPIFEQKEYFSDFTFEPIAEAMLRDDAQLRAEFGAALAADASLRSNPRARLTWLFRRSPYFEPDRDLYPVIRVNRRPW